MNRSSLLFPGLTLGFDPWLNESQVDSTSHVEENNEGYFLQFDAPGVKKEHVRISIERGHLLVEAVRKGRVERQIRRSFSLPDDVDTDRIEAQLRDGVMELALPKKEKAKAKLIPVSEGKESFFQRLIGNSGENE